MRVAYYSPLPPSRSGVADYSALLLPALRERVDVVVAEPGRRRRRQPTSRSTTSATTPRRTAGSSTRCARGRASSCCTSSSSTTSSPGITLGRGDARGYLDAMERELGVAGRLLGLGVIDKRCRRSGRRGRSGSRSPATILGPRHGLIVHSRFVEERAREAGYDGPVWRIPHPAWPLADVEPAATSTASPLIGCFGHLNESKRIPQLLEALPRCARVAPAPGCCSPARRAAFDLARRLTGSGSPTA